MRHVFSVLQRYKLFLKLCKMNYAISIIQIA